MTLQHASLRAARSVTRRCKPSPDLLPYVTARSFRTGTPLRRGTHGVFRGLSDERLPMPWIEAFKLKQEGQVPNFAESQQQERDMSPKKMKDSYHRVVSHLN